jgi:hypothetical protein
MTDDNRALALRLARAGVPVFPCNPEAGAERFKTPLGGVLWRKESTTDPATIAAWWDRFPGAMPGIDVGKARLLVLDGDAARRADEPDGVTALNNLLAEHGFLTHSVEVETPSGGSHVYFRQNGTEIGNAGRLKKAHNIDVRGIGGYVIAPGAIDTTGRVYSPRPNSLDLAAAFQAGAIPMAPAWLEDILREAPAEPRPEPPPWSVAGERERKYAMAALLGVAGEIAALPEGQRNNALFAKAAHIGNMVGSGWLPQSTAWATLEDAGATCGLPLREVRTTLKQAFGTGIRTPHPPLEDRPQERSEPFLKPETKARREPPGPRTKLVSAADLQTMVFPEIKYVVPGYIAEGLSILAGKPKIGKSWLVMDCALGVAYGGSVMGNIACEQGDVLYLALEDNRRRLQKRINQMLPDAAWPARLTIASLEEGWPTLDKGGLAEIKKWVDTVERPRLIIVDTLAKVRGSKRDEDSAYESDYRAVTAMHALANQHGIAIVLVHHVRKMEAEDPVDTVSGTTGLTGAVDTILVLKRDGDGAVTLYGRGRDIEEIESSLTFDKTTGRWTNHGDARLTKRSDTRLAILTAMEEGAESVSEIVAASGLERNVVDQQLWKMKKDGEVEKAGRGVYILGMTVARKIVRNSETA